MKRFISMIIICCFFINSVPIFAQTVPIKENEPLAVELKPIKSKILKAKYLSPVFAKLYKADKEIIDLGDDLKKKGFQVQKGIKNFWGIQETFSKDGKTVTYSVYIQDYTKPNSKDTAAIGQVRVIAGDRSEMYSFSLEAPDGDFDKAIEYRIDKKLGISKANSWWSCVKRRLLGSTATCAGSLLTCAPAAATWAGYLACVAASCGFAYAKVTACCSCDCSWWCRGAVGCCDR